MTLDIFGLTPDPIPSNQAVDNTFRWGTVSSISPLRIQLDGDSTPLNSKPDSLVGTLSVGQRVWCQLFRRRVIILGTPGIIGPYIFDPTDLNNELTTGVKSFANASATSNFPEPGVGGNLVVANGSDMITQTFVTYNNGNVYKRIRYNTTWRPWKRLDLASASDISEGTLAIPHGGTGSTSAAAARTALGIPTNPAAGTAGMRSLGTGSTNACAGNDPRLSDPRIPRSTTYNGPAINANNIQTSGFYGFSNSSASASFPVNGGGGVMIVAETGVGILQDFTRYATGESWRRIYYTAGGTWTSWRSI